MRTAKFARKTRETDVVVELNLDGTGRTEIATGLGFLDHLLDALCRHAHWDVTLRASGDLHVDDHHTAEDCALALGTALDQALGDRAGIQRFGSAYAPLDEALARAVVDLSGRPSPHVALALKREQIGGLACENMAHCLESLAIAGRMALHVDVLKGRNDHHKVEAAFKASALALRFAVSPSGLSAVPSSEGGAVMVAIVRTGAANLASVTAALGRLGVEARVIETPAEATAAERLVLPGVGAFGAAMARLQAADLVAPLRERIQAGRPTLAICLGLQLLFEASAESPGVPGLGVVAGGVERFVADRVPQLGWNAVTAEPGGLVEPGYAYFANSYRVAEAPADWHPSHADYGGRFVAALQRGPVLACQFHPELSGPWGADLLRRWLEVPC